MDAQSFKLSKYYPTFKKIILKSGMQEKDYQLEGIAWAIRNESGSLPFNVRGGIIADEMGLGKTFQIISTITCNFKMKTIIVLPPILIQQWVDAFINITGHTPLVYHSTFNKISNIHIHTINTSPIIITTYGMIAINNKKNRNIIHSISWDRIIFDEAHHLRNKNTHIFNGASIIQAKIKWFITGTPIQNNINDLYNLFHILNIPKHIYKQLENIEYLKKKFILKRNKNILAKNILPPIIHHIIIHPNNNIETFIANDIHQYIIDEQNEKNEKNELIENMHSHIIQKHIIHKQNITYDTPNTKIFNLIDQTQNKLLASLIRARQFCIFPPTLIKHIHKFKHEIHNKNDIDIYYKALTHTNKLNSLIQIIYNNKQHKNIIFCHFKHEILFLLQQLNKIHIQTQFIDGTTSLKQKNHIINTSPNVLILQIQTSCEGLNLQQYSHIYFTSPHWNPAVEKQAIARAHRIGQIKQVHVFKLIYNNSIEQHIIHTQNHKHTIAKNNF